MCLVIDCLASLVFLIFCAKREWARAGVFLFELLIVSVYFYLDVMVFLNGVKWFFKLPAHLQKIVPKAMIGLGAELKTAFGQ